MILFYECKWSIVVIVVWISISEIDGFLNGLCNIRRRRILFNTSFYIKNWKSSIWRYAVPHDCMHVLPASQIYLCSSQFSDQLCLQLFCNEWLAIFYVKEWLCKCGLSHTLLPLLCWYLICMQPLSLLAPRRAEVHIMVIPRALLWIFQRDATQHRENLDQYRWINQCFGISQRKPALSSKRETC